MKLSKLALGLFPITLGTACIPSKVHVHDYNDIKVGPAVLTGYLRSPVELTLYTSIDDARAHRYKNCISGIVENMDPANTILYDNRFVEIKGRVIEYYISEDPMEAMLAAVKNNCNSPRIFVARQIRVLSR